MEKQLDFVEDLVHETEICIRDAYYRGYEEGNKVNKLTFKTNSELLESFLSHVRNHYQLYHDQDLGIKFASKNVLYQSDTIIKNFLLSYDND